MATYQFNSGNRSIRQILHYTQCWGILIYVYCEIVEEGLHIRNYRGRHGPQPGLHSIAKGLTLQQKKDVN